MAEGDNAPAPAPQAPAQPAVPTAQDVQISEGDILSFYGLAVARLEVTLRAIAQRDMTIKQLTTRNAELSAELEAAQTGTKPTE